MKASDNDDHKVFNNSKTARDKALIVLEKAKALEAQQLKNGAKWKLENKTARLVKTKK